MLSCCLCRARAEGLDVSVTPVFAIDLSTHSIDFVIAAEAGGAALPVDDICVIPSVDSVSKQSELETYLLLNPGAAVHSPDGSMLSISVPLSALGIGATGSHVVGVTAVALGGEFRRGHAQARVSGGVGAAGNSTSIDWPSPNSVVPVHSYLNQQTPAITHADTGGIVVTFGSAAHPETSTYSVAINGSVVLQAVGLTALSAHSLVSGITLGQSGAQVALDLTSALQAEQLCRITSRSVNPDGTFVATGAFWVAKFGARFVGVGKQELVQGVNMTIHELSLTGPPNATVTLNDPSVTDGFNAFAFVESPISGPAVTIQLDSAGLGRARLFGFHDFARTGAPLSLRGTGSSPLSVEYRSDAIRHAYLPQLPGGTLALGGEDNMRIGGNLRENGMPGPQGLTLGTFLGEAVAKTKAITDQYTFKAKAVDERWFDPDVGFERDISNCVIVFMEIMDNGFPHVSTMAVTDCVLAQFPDLEDIDHVTITACKKPGADPGLPDVVDGGEFDF